MPVNNRSTKDAAIAALVSQKYILLVRQPDHYDARWKMPGGGVEVGEAPEQALVREVQEETGFQIPSCIKNKRLLLGDAGTKIIHLTDRKVERPNTGTHVQYFFVVEIQNSFDLFGLDQKTNQEDDGSVLESKVFDMQEVLTRGDFLYSQKSLFEQMLAHCGFKPLLTPAYS